MVDARLPERYLMDRRIARLSPEDFRGFVFATLWSVSNRTDGVILDEDLSIVPHVSNDVPARLVAAGVWERIEGGWIIVDFSSTQTSRHELEVLEGIRRRDREKKSRKRTRDREGVVPRESPGEPSPGTAQERKGEERQAGTVTTREWPVVAIPQGDESSCWVCGDAVPAGSLLCEARDLAHEAERVAGPGMEKAG